MHTRKAKHAKDTPLAPLKGGIVWALCFIALLALTQMARAQNADTVFTRVIEVDQIPRSAYARTPSVALDEDENFIIAWSAESKGQPEIFLRRFDAIGRSLTNILPLSEIAGSGLNLENPHLAYVGGGFTWIVWQQRNAGAASTVMGMILNQDLKVVRAPFVIHEDPDPYTHPRVIVDRSGRVLVTWVLEVLPIDVVARLFNRDGTPLTNIFSISQDSQMLRLGEELAVAVSSTGMFAVAWHAYEANADMIYLRLFSDRNVFTNDPVVIAQRSVFHPSLAFGSEKEIVAQWFTNSTGSVLRAQRFDLNADSLSAGFNVVTGIDKEPRSAILLANERGVFNSFWSVTVPRDATASEIFTRTFLLNEQPLNEPRVLARAPQRTGFATELNASILSSGNYVVAFTGNDTSITLPAPRIGAIVRKPALPDLNVFDLTLTPANPTRADSVIATFKVRNLGLAPAPASLALLDLTANTEARLIPIPPLGVAQTQTFRFNFGPLMPRSYTLRVIVDDSQEIPEADEKNNIASQLFKVDEAATLVVDPLTLDFAGTVGQPNPAAQFFVIKNSGSDSLKWQATANAPWINFSPDTGTVTINAQTINVSVDLTGLAQGSYQSNIIINSNGGRAVVAINLTIAAALPSLDFSPKTLNFAATQGGLNPPEKYIVIRNAGSGLLTTKLTSNQPWLLLKPDTVATTQRDSAQALIALGNLVAGTYTGAITIRANGGVGVVNVTLVVSPQPPALEVLPRSLNFVATEGTANPPSQPVTVRNIGGGTLQWSVIEQVDWLSFNSRSGSTTSETDTIRVIASITRLQAGAYSEIFRVNAGSDGEQEVRVNFTVNARPRFPDLVVLAQSRGLDSCFAADYGYATEFVVQNLGETAAGPSTAQLVLNNEIRQRQSLPALDVGASYTLRFASENLNAGFTQVACEVGVGATFQESATSNNVARYREWVPRRGDVNADSALTLQDLFRLVDLVLQRNVGQSSLRECWAANVSVDAGLDIADVVAFVDVLLNNGSTTNLAEGGALELQLTALLEQKTRLLWSASSPLRAWQATWKLPHGARDLPLRSFQQNGFEVDWKIVHNELRLLVWRTNEASAANVEHSFELPLALPREGLAQVVGAMPSGAMLQLTAKVVGAELPQSFRLSPAYPNPWHTGAIQKIVWQYELPEPAIAEMRLYNVLGQEVRHLSFGLMPAGRGEVHWDGRDRTGRMAAPGIYFVELVAGKFKQRQRLVIF